MEHRDNSDCRSSVVITHFEDLIAERMRAEHHALAERWFERLLTLIPVDARDWDAHMPTDAPPVAKTLLARLRSGT